MNKLHQFFVVLLTLQLCACTIEGSPSTIQGSGTLASEERQLSGVHGVTLSTFGDLTITIGNQESLQIEAEDNLLPYIETEVRSGVLTIRTKPNINVRPTRSVRFNLTAKRMDALTVTSNGNITAPALQADRFAATISSNGDILLAGLEADSLQVKISSNGNLTINGGEVKRQTVDLTSSGQYKAGAMRSQSADIRLSSNGGATIWVTGSLNARLSSSGNVSYYGRPAISAATPAGGRLVSLGDK